MKVTKNSASATLTDVKNKIGDVFSLVDDFGEVTITSYNKPAYKITKITSEEKKELKEEKEQVKVEEEVVVDEAIEEPVQESTPAAEEVVVEKEVEPQTDTEEVTITEPVEQEIVAETPTIDVPTEIPESMEVEPAITDTDKLLATTVEEEKPAEPETPAPAENDVVAGFQPPAEFADLLKEEIKENETAIDQDNEAIGTESSNSIVEFIAKSESTVEEEKPATANTNDSSEWSRNSKLESDWVQKVRNLL